MPYNFRRPDIISDPLYVVTPVINSGRFRSRWKHYGDFAKHVAEAGAILYTVEVAFGDRAFVVTDPANPRHLQLRTSHELWLKEQAINICVQRLPQDWKYVAWIDADCMFARHDWADETKHVLQHYPIAQLWSHLIDMAPDYAPIKQIVSFAQVFLHGQSLPGSPGSGQKWGAPGMAWAAERSAWDQMGGLFDVSILGAGDWYFANSIAGTVGKMIDFRNDFTPAFRRHVDIYADRIARSNWHERALQANLGMVPGTVMHYWHGARSSRGYQTRGHILTRNNYDPDLDLKRDWQGLYQLTNHNPQLRRDIQAYFAARDDDASGIITTRPGTIQ